MIAIGLTRGLVNQSCCWPFFSRADVSSKVARELSPDCLSHARPGKHVD